MSDRLHDHTTLGFRRGCVACAQTEADLALARNALAAAQNRRLPASETLPGVDTRPK